MAIRSIKSSKNTITRTNKEDKSMKNTITLTDAQLQDIIAQAVATAIAGTKNATTKGTSKKTSGTGKKTAKKTTRKSTSKKVVELEPVELIADDDTKTVSLSRFVRNRNVYGFVDKNVVECGGSRTDDNKAWVFSNKTKYNKFCKVFADIDVSTLTEEQLNEGYEWNKSKIANKPARTDEQKAQYKATFESEWAKWVAQAKKDGIKRTSEMNKAKAEEIRKAMR